MLILTARPKKDDDIIIIKLGDFVVELILLGIKGNQARIGVNAPREVSVYRKVIYNRIQEEGKNSSKE